MLSRSIVRPVRITAPSIKTGFQLAQSSQKNAYAWFQRVQKLCERAIGGAVRLH